MLQVSKSYHLPILEGNQGCQPFSQKRWTGEKKCQNGASETYVFPEKAVSCGEGGQGGIGLTNAEEGYRAAAQTCGAHAHTYRHTHKTHILLS